MRYDALLFDFDGLLMDTEAIHIVAWEVYLKEYGLRATEEQLAHGVGMTDARVAENFKAMLGLKPAISKIVSDKADIYYRMLGEADLRPLPGVVDLLAGGTKAGFALGVCSSSQSREVELGLRRMLEGMSRRGEGNLPADPRKVFRHICCGDVVEATRRKPEPDLYLLAAKAMGVAPGKCLALEDSPSGSKAAVAAGMGCVCALTRYTRNMEFPEGVRKVNSLAEVAADPERFGLPFSRASAVP